MDFTSLKLMIPGPIQPEKAVLEAMGMPVQPHYGPAWTAFYTETTNMLKPVFGTAGNIFLLVGSGTSGLDACLGSSLSSGEKIIIGSNGFFGERLIAIAEAYNLNVVKVMARPGLPLEPQAFEQAIHANPDAKMIALVHLETSTAVVNPIQEIGPLARKHGLYMMVDAVSSLGGIPFKMDDWCIDLCASASQKCLGSTPGLSPVAVGARGWEAIDRDPHKGHGYYTSLANWRKYATEWADWHPHPITMATNNIFALRVALESLKKEGIEVRMARYRALALRLRAGLRKIGMPPFTPDESLAPVLTAAYAPEGVPSGKIVSYLADTHHIKISGGLGDELKEKLIRIGHMSPVVTEADIDEVLAALAQFKA